MPEQTQAAPSVEYVSSYDIGKDIGRDEERDDVLDWLRGVRVADLKLRHDSSPSAVLFAVREAIERGDHRYYA